jgi:hypothetical protein
MITPHTFVGTRERCDMCFGPRHGAEHQTLTYLCELARKYGTDKGGWHTIAGETCHVYTPAYYEMWEARRFDVRHVLEIGVNYGGSLRMWSEYFPAAQIFGLDSNAACLFNEGRIKCLAADQNSGSSLATALAQMGLPKFDFIVDDGSHEPAHQLFSVNFLMPSLKQDGIYVIEDIHYDCQPEVHMVGLDPAYKWEAINTGVGIGKAHCWDQCPKCHGAEGERLLKVTHV